MNLEIGRIGPLVIDHVMVVNNTEQERSRLLLNMEESFAKEMPKRFKFVTLNLAQVSSIEIPIILIHNRFWTNIEHSLICYHSFNDYHSRLYLEPMARMGTMQQVMRRWNHLKNTKYQTVCTIRWTNLRWWCFPNQRVQQPNLSRYVQILFIISIPSLQRCTKFAIIFKYGHFV